MSLIQENENNPDTNRMENNPNCMRVQRCLDNARIPTLGSEGAAGYDIYAAESLIIQPNTRVKVSTGIKMMLPKTHCGRICSRSGLAMREGIDVVAGVIDEDYRGEILVGLHSTRPIPYEITEGDRIAQMLIFKVFKPNLLEVNDMDETKRGEDGFGSTGV